MRLTVELRRQSPGRTRDRTKSHHCALALRQWSAARSWHLRPEGWSQRVRRLSYAVTCGIPLMAAVSIYSLEGLAGMGGRRVFGLLGAAAPWYRTVTAQVAYPRMPDP